MIENTAVAIARAEAVLERYGHWGHQVRQIRGLAPALRSAASNNASDEAHPLASKKLADRYGTLLQTPRVLFLLDPRFRASPRTGLAEIERLESLGVIDERMLIVIQAGSKPRRSRILARRKAIAGVCAKLQPAQRAMCNFPVRQAARAFGARRVNVAVGLRSRKFRNCRHGGRIRALP